MDGHYIYVFIRQDLPLPLQMVHACHAVYEMTRCYPSPVSGRFGTPNLILIGCANLVELEQITCKLYGLQFPYASWTDPDNVNLGRLGVATAPITREQKKHLKGYRLYSLGPASKDAACCLTADEGANAVVAQLREHSVFNGEVASPEKFGQGENPANGSIQIGRCC